MTKPTQHPARRPLSKEERDRVQMTARLMRDDGSAVSDANAGVLESYEATVRELEERVRVLGEALEEAARSLEALSMSGGRESDIEDFVDVRGYANSRAKVARRALADTAARRPVGGG